MTDLLSTLTVNQIGLLILFGSAVVSWGLTKAFREALLLYFKKVNVIDLPWWWNLSLRLCSIFMGGLTALLVMKTSLAFMVGLCGGALNTIIVMFVKKMIQKKTDVGDE